MTHRDLIGLEKRMRESQERSQQRRREHKSDHRGVTYFLLGALCMILGVGVLAVEVVQDDPDKALVCGAMIATFIGAMVIMDWWDRA